MQITLSHDLLPWEKQPDEQEHWFDRFDRYAKTLGAEYTVLASWRLFRVANPTQMVPFDMWNEYADAYLWDQRARAWGKWDREQYKQKWDRRREQLADADWDQGMRLRMFGEQVLSAMELHRVAATVEKDGKTTVYMKLTATPTQVTQILKTASELQRLGAGEPTEIHEDRAPAVGVYLPAINTVEVLSEPESGSETVVGTE